MFFSANNHNTQIQVTGWKQVQNGTMHNSSGTYTLYYNGEGLCHLKVTGQANIQGAGGSTTMFTLNSGYRPLYALARNVNSKQWDITATLWSNGNFVIYNTTGSGSVTVEYEETYRV